jgi:hypothetical protein
MDPLWTRGELRGTMGHASFTGCPSPVGPSHICADMKGHLKGKFIVSCNPLVALLSCNLVYVSHALASPASPWGLWFIWCSVNRAFQIPGPGLQCSRLPSCRGVGCMLIAWHLLRWCVLRVCLQCCLHLLCAFARTPAVCFLWLVGSVCHT